MPGRRTVGTRHPRSAYRGRAVTGRATFGEFLQAARKCTEPEGHGGRATGRHDIVGVSHGLGRVVAAMSRYLDDVMATCPMLPSAKRSAESAWALAAAQA